MTANQSLEQPVTPEMIEAGEAVLQDGVSMDADKAVEAIYLAMSAARPVGDEQEVERAIERLVIDGRAKKDSLSPEQREAADDEARAFYRKVFEHFRIALSAMQDSGAIGELRDQLERMTLCVEQGDFYGNIGEHAAKSRALLSKLEKGQ